MHTKDKWVVYREPYFDNGWKCSIKTVIENMHPARAFGWSEEECLANAEYICKCVNNHENLVNGIKQAIDDICGRCTVITGAVVCSDCMCIDIYRNILRDIDND